MVNIGKRKGDSCLGSAALSLTTNPKILEDPEKEFFYFIFAGSFPEEQKK